ncbi:STAS domain-containing protein [Desulfuribacillus stibiiarsenatis]|nr:STAS domain-containing protein [Desulfuribacillus stibiiarsenatis]
MITIIINEKVRLMTIVRKGNSADINNLQRIDIVNKNLLKEKLNEMLLDRDLHQIRINFNTISKVDCTGIGLLLSFHKIIQEMGGKLILYGIKDRSIQTIFQMIHLDRVITIAD